MILNNFRRKLLLIGAPVVLVGAGLSTMAASAATPTATPAPTVEQSGTEKADATEATSAAEPSSAAEAATEANEPALPGGGHADAADANVDNQFDGIQ